MMAILWLLLGPSACGDESNKTFHSRSALATSTTFTFCKFDRCQDPLDGGAVYVCDEFINLTLSSSNFSQCRSLSGRGGGLYAFCLNFGLAETDASGCYAPQHNSFCYAVIDSTATGSLEVSRSSACLCTGARSTVHFASYTCSSGSNTSVIELNSSSNVAHDYASGLHVAHHFGLCLQFCTFAHNSRANCLLFYDEIRATNITCIGLFNSSCHFNRSYAGLLHIRADVEMCNSFFHSNDCDFFLGGSSVATFSECAFDTDRLTTTGVGSITTPSCVVASDIQLSANANCPWPDPTPTASESQTPTETVSQTATPTSSESPIETESPSETHTPIETDTPIEPDSPLESPTDFVWARTETATFPPARSLGTETIAPPPEQKNPLPITIIAAAAGGGVVLIIIIIAIIFAVKRSPGGDPLHSPLRRDFGRDPFADVPPLPPDFDNMPPPQLI